MTATIPELLSLSLTERLQLVEDLWDSIAAETADFPLTPAQREEVDWRLAEHDRDPESALPWVEIQSRLTRRFA